MANIVSVITGMGIILMFGLICAGLGFGVGYNFHKIRKIRQDKELEKVSNEPPEIKKVPEYAEIIEGKRYSTLDAKSIAQGSALFGYIWLLRTMNNNFFILLVNVFGIPSIASKTQPEAIQYFTSAPIREVKFEDAFPDVKISDA